MDVLLAVNNMGRVLGFAEVSIRPYAEGRNSARVAYLEGWFVEKGVRRTGVGAALVAAVEEWGRAHGCSELASDSDVHHDSSIAAQRPLGSDEVDRIVCFRKALTDTDAGR
jgi:aminoglycoside 6'-N-acetyltransferase I